MNCEFLICVLNSKYIHSSLAPYYLASGVKTNAPELFENLQILEGTINQDQNQIFEKIISNNPKIIGFSCYIWNITFTLNLCKRLKKYNQNLVIILGGPEVSFNASQVLRENDFVDYILTGEGEETLPKFLKIIIKNNYSSLSQEQVEKIEGLCARIGQTIISSPPKLLVSPPAPSLVNYSQSLNGRIAYFESSRGCPFSCAFCLSGRNDTPRYFNLEQTFKDLLTLANSGTKTIKFVDRTFNANPKHANQILKFILENYNKSIPNTVCFHFEIAADILKEETFELLEKMPIGAVQLEVGMQSFCEKTLEAVHRKTNTELVKKNVTRLLRFKNMHIHIDLIAGLPYEDLKTFEVSFNTAYNLKAQMLQLGFLKMLHGSTMRNNLDKFPCEFDQNPPYQIKSTPYLAQKDLSLLEKVEEALERVYNSGRFLLSTDYCLKVSELTPFEFYRQLGLKLSIATNAKSLDNFTSVFFDFCKNLKKVNPDILRDQLVKDRLSTNASGKLAPCLFVSDKMLAKATYLLSLDKNTAQKKGVKRGIALLYGKKKVCYTDYTNDNFNRVTSRYNLIEIPFQEFDF